MAEESSEAKFHSREGAAEEQYHHAPKPKAVKPVSGSNRFICCHCKIPFVVSRNARKLKLLLEGVIKRPLCVPCETRDSELSAGVSQCLRAMSGAGQVSDVIGVFADEKKAREMLHDPFRMLRQKYKKDDTLSLQDIEDWIADGTIRWTDDGKIAQPDKAFQREMELREQIRQTKDEMSEERRRPAREPAQDQSGSISRRKEDGGALMGGHYRDAMHDD